MAGKRTPATLNGNNINDGAIYRAKFLADSGIGEVFASDAVTVEIARQFPQYVASQPNGRALPMQIDILRRSTANHYDDVKQIKDWCSTRQDEITLTATDEDSNSIQLTVKPLRFEPRDGTDWIYTAWFWVSRPVWEATTETDTTDATPSDVNVTNNGSDSVRPRITLTFSGKQNPASYPDKMRHAVVVPRSKASHTDANGNPYPVDITGGGWDVSAAIDAGTFNPSGADLLVYVNGLPQNRYLSNLGAGYGDGSAIDEAAFRTWETTHNDSWHAQIFRLGGCSENDAVTIEHVTLWLQKTGAPTGTMAVQIWSADPTTGLPDAIVHANAQFDLDVSTLTTSLTQQKLAAAGAFTLNPHTWYWLVVPPPTGGTHDVNNYVQIANHRINVLAEDCYGEWFPSCHSTDGAAWLRGADMLSVASHGASNDAICAIAHIIHAAGTMKIWVPLALPEAVELSLGRAMTAIVPGLLVFDMHLADLEGHARLPDRGMVCVITEDVGEIVGYEAKVGDRELTVRSDGRLIRGTTNALHNVGDPVYLAPLDVRIAYGHTDMHRGQSAYQPVEQAPAIDGINSTNTHIEQAGPYLVEEGSIRPGTFRVALDDGQELYEYVALDMNPANDLADITFADQLPTGDFVNRNIVAKKFPVPIAASANAITFDCPSIPASMAVDVIGVTERGAEELLATFRTADAGSALTITPTSPIYELRFLVRTAALVGCETGDAVDDSNIFTQATLPGFGGGQTFTVDEQSTIIGAAIRLKADDTKTFTATLRIYGTTEDANGIMVPDANKLIAESASFDADDVASTYTNIFKTFSNLTLDPGVYALVIWATAEGGSGSAYWSSKVAGFARGHGWTAFGTIDAQGEDHWFRIFGTPAQADAIFGSGGTLSLDNFEFDLDADLAPYVALGAEVNGYLPADTLANNTTGQSLQITGPPLPEGTIADIDFEELTCDVDDPNLAEPSLWLLDAYDLADPFRYDPGANDLAYTTTGTVSLRTRHRDQYL